MLDWSWLPDVVKLVGLLIVVVYLTQLIKSFGYMSLAELRRRAKSGNQRAWAVYQSRRFGLRNSICLWTALAAALALLITHINNLLGFWAPLGLALATIVLIGTQMLAAGLRWPPASLRLASQVGPALGWLFGRLSWRPQSGPNPPGVSWLESDDGGLIHSRADHLEKLQQQLHRRRDRSSRAEIELAIRALQFADKTVAETMVSRRTMAVIKENLELTPAVLEELYQTKEKYVAVIDRSRRDFIGVLVVADLGPNLQKDRRQSAGQLMNRSVYYVKAQAPLEVVFRAFLKTSQHFFLVVNHSGKVVGKIDIEAAIKEVIALTRSPTT